MINGDEIVLSKRVLFLLRIIAVIGVVAPFPLFGQTCGNPVACENILAGNLPTEWDVSGSGDPTIQGFATDISVNRGQSINFKITTTAPSYRIDIYRLGYYGGRGARKVASIAPSAVQNQPACLRDVSTGLLDCGNWTLSASWAVPSTATSGVYIARPVRLDTGGASHIFFVVRNDAGQSEMLFQTSDLTWQAYNTYGGASLYGGNGPSADGRAYKVSYNRPFNNRATIAGDSTPLGFLFTTEYPMIRWLEANGYDVSYAAGVDTDRRGSAALTSHKIFLSVGHDEYWSGAQRSNVEAARAAGVNLAFFSGNEIFWKTRWENSIAGSTTSYRTLVCYKETHANAKIDPTTVWTGTWRDPRFSPPGDGGRPENALTGQLFTVNGDRSDPMRLTAADGKLRFWRNTGLDTLLEGQIAQLPVGVLGYEWDEPVDNGFRPPGLVPLSTTTIRVDGYYIQDYGSHYGPGTASHSLTLYRHSSGALVFGAGTTQWAWGLDGTHDYPGTATDSRMQQATVNLFADMGVQPTALNSGLLPATKSTDTLPPTSLIVTSPGLTVPAWTAVAAFGTAVDLGGGRPAAVEISTDAGTTWHPAQGAANWSASWTTGAPGLVTVKTRAVDDSGRIENVGAGIALTVTGNSARPTLWPPETVPTVLDNPDSSAVELGVRFKADRNGWITALRFYKSAANTGPHVGNLWTNNGTLLATVTFTNETASGWQQAQLASPVAVTAGTFYVASYHTNVGHYSHDVDYFAGQGVDSPPLSAPADGLAGANGLYHYGPSAFPTDTSRSSNYWIDVTFAVDLGADITPPLVSGISPSVGVSNVGILSSVYARFSEPIAPATISGSNFFLKDAQNNLVQASLTYDSSSRTARLQPTTSLNELMTYTATVKSGSAGVTDLPGNRLSTDFIWSFTTGGPPNGGYSLWPPETLPAVLDNPDPSAVELGVRFKADQNGWITALRFYKSAANTGPHVGNLWTNNGTLLATVTFTNETASGWQQAQLASPVAVTAGTFYVASYHTNVGHYSHDVDYFAIQGVDSRPLSAPADGLAGANGLYHYGPSAFPTDTSRSSNYWIDVAFNPTIITATPIFTPPSGTYNNTLSVSISDATPGAQIYYTTNGSTPSTSSTRYTAPISVASTTTLKAIAVASGWSVSPISTSTYTIQPAQTAQPTFSPGGGSYPTNQSVALSDATPGATIYYTTNGSTPTSSSTRYTAPIAVSAPTTIKAIATASGLPNSSVASATYAFQADPPSFNPVGGTYGAPQSVTLSDVSPGAAIYYTTNGTTPTTASTRYTAAIPVGATTTINAIAAVTGWSTSGVSTSTYTIQLPARPPAPTGLSATAASATQVNLAWSDVATNETGFKIERKTGTTGTYAQIATLGPNFTAYSDSTVSATTTYVYRLRATNAGGDSSYSNEATVTTPAPAAPPPPWTQVGIGSPGVAGSATFASGTFTVKGSGADIWGSADAFHFVSQSLTGNGEILARVTSVQNTDPWAKAGVMIRESTASNSKNALMAITPGSGLTFQRRLSTGGASTYTAGAAGAAPYWVRLVRSGNTITGYASTNGVSWTQVGSDTISMASTVLVGLAVTAHNNTSLNTSIFDNVAVGTQLGAPSALTATPASSSQINLSWVDNATGETGLKIERKTGAAGTYAQIATVGAGVTVYSDTGLASATTYFYRVRATNAIGDSSYSTEASATTLTPPPAAPASLTASTVSSSQINLSWTDVTNETGFKIERKTGASGTYVQIATVAAGVTTYGNTGLSANITYYYRVRATNAGGDSPYSPEANATTLNTAPAAPSGLSATATSTTQVNLSWIINSSNETGFRIERSVGGNFVEITTIGAGSSAFSDTGLSPGTNYLYRVRATNSLGDSPYSNQASATTFVPVPPAPLGLIATAASSSQINVSWTDVANETSYKIERKTGAAGTYAQIAIAGAGVVTLSDAGLTANTTYFYRVRASNAGGDSAYSSEASATTLNSVPATPGGLAATAVSGTQINLSWTDVANETGFKIERKTGAGGTYAQIATVGSGVVAYNDTGLTAATTYFYRIRATNALGDSAYSIETSATTSSALPAAPTGLAASVISGTQINLSWGDVANETGYKIERKTGAGGTYAQIATTAAGVVTYNNTGLAAGTTYFYRVRASNAAGDSPYSAEVSALSFVPTFRAAASKGATSGVLTLTINKPAGTAQGDVMIASVSVRPSTATISAPGWTLVRRMDNGNTNPNSLAVYYKVAGASEPATYSWTFNTSTGSAGGIRSFYGVDTASPVDVEAGQNTPNAVTHAAPSVTTRFASDMIVTSHAFSSSASFTPPSGMAEAFDIASDSAGSGGEAIEGNYFLQTAIGVSGAKTATASNDADVGNAHTLALKGR